MGTRADFYVGDGQEAEWLGSIAWDGYRDGIPDLILNCTDEALYRLFVRDFISGRKDGTLPEMGWPWPWDTSGTTDCCYAFRNGKVDSGSWGVLYEPDDEDCERPIGGDFPDMKDRKATTFGERSGVIIIGS